MIVGTEWKPSSIEKKKDPRAYKILEHYRKQKWIQVIHNKTGYNNAETFGRLILPFWFKDEPNPDNILITMDGAGCHNINNILDYAQEELGGDKVPK